MTVRCGNKIHDTDTAEIHHHDTVSEVRLCFALTFQDGNKLFSVEESDELDYENFLAERTCSICDGLGHGYPGGGPCPLEVSPVVWMEEEEDRLRALGMR